MLDRSQRTAILELHKQQVPLRTIAQTLKVSRPAVRKVIESQSREPPPLERAEKAEPYRNEILDLYASCQGNLVRVHEELCALGATLSYPALTAFCRKEQIGREEKKPVGQYHFAPGEELQHDTSPFRAMLGGVARLIQIVSAVLCYSRKLFFQCSPTFQRFDCKVFLTEAFLYFQGATRMIMIDNTHVIVLRGTGAEMVPVPEMAAFAERYHTQFIAHEKGDANRSARVEGPFHFIQRNFFAGRTFSDWDDLNVQARAWCDKVNSTYKKHLRAIPNELYAVERCALQPLPLWVPEVYRLHQRVVDMEGYVSLHSNRYSVPAAWIGRQVQIRETKDHVEIEDGRRNHVRHRRLVDCAGRRFTLPEHRVARGQAKKPAPALEEQTLCEAFPEISDYVAALKKRGPKQPTLALRQLLRLGREYPREAFLSAVRQAAQYGLYDLERLERMILRLIAQDYFRLDPKKGDDDEG
jgi:hypothetical protein